MKTQGAVPSQNLKLKSVTTVIRRISYKKLEWIISFLGQKCLDAWQEIPVVTFPLPTDVDTLSNKTEIPFSLKGTRTSNKTHTQIAQIANKSLETQRNLRKTRLNMLFTPTLPGKATVEALLSNAKQC